MQHLQPNTTLQGGKYRIERVLGQGGFGITYLARNTVFDVNVAIKEFFMKDENDRDGSLVTMPNSTKTELFLGQKEKFKKEAKRMFAIKNEHIVAVHDLFEENGTAYYVMDYVDGENLNARLKRTGQPMSEEEVSKILPQILDALQTVHDAGIWHLDLKPANIMVDKAGQVKLIDFGASKQLNAQKGGATTSTAISYTNGFAPREQMEQNYDKFGPWTDLYALGATLYNLLTNQLPPLPTDIDDDMSDDKHLALPMPNVSSKMKQLILWLMKTNRMQRPRTIAEVEQSLKDFVFAEKVESTIHTIVQAPQIQQKELEKTILGNNSLEDTFFQALEDADLGHKKYRKVLSRNNILLFLMFGLFIIMSSFLIFAKHNFFAFQFTTCSAIILSVIMVITSIVIQGRDSLKYKNRAAKYTNWWQIFIFSGSLLTFCFLQFNRLYVGYESWFDYSKSLSVLPISIISLFLIYYVENKGYAPYNKYWLVPNRLLKTNEFGNKSYMKWMLVFVFWPIVYLHAAIPFSLLYGLFVIFPLLIAYSLYRIWIYVRFRL